MIRRWKQAAETLVESSVESPYAINLLEHITKNARHSVHADTSGVSL